MGSPWPSPPAPLPARPPDRRERGVKCVGPKNSIPAFLPPLPEDGEGGPGEGGRGGEGLYGRARDSAAPGDALSAPGGLLAVRGGPRRTPGRAARLVGGDEPELQRLTADPGLPQVPEEGRRHVLGEVDEA